MVYGAFAALAQKDFKRLVAYSSVSHMGYVVLGLGVWSASAGNDYNPDYWKMGVNGAMFQMIAHGISSAGMFFMVGVIYDRVHHRNLERVRRPVRPDAGLQRHGDRHLLRRPRPAGPVRLHRRSLRHALASGSSAKCWRSSRPRVVILTAGYILWAMQRVYLGAEYKGPHGDHLHDVDARELAIAAPLVALAILFGVYPQVIFEVHDAERRSRASRTWPTWTETTRCREAGSAGRASSR